MLSSTGAGTWTTSSCVSAQETEIWRNPEGESGLGRGSKAPITSETTTKILQGVLCSRAGGCEVKKLESSLQVPTGRTRQRAECFCADRRQLQRQSDKRSNSQQKKAPSNSGWCPAENGRYNTLGSDNRAFWAASVIVTEAGYCSVNCGVNPPYWNLDVEEDVVRTPLSDESRRPLSVRGS